MPSDIENRYLSIVDDKKYMAWKKRFRVNVGMLPFGSELFVEKGENGATFEGTDEELLNLLEASVSSNRDLISPRLKIDKKPSFFKALEVV